MECSFNTLWIYTALKQNGTGVSICRSFNTLWIYTALKHVVNTNKNKNVSIPSEFTLLSNAWCWYSLIRLVSIPSEFTLLSNPPTLKQLYTTFQYPLNLHCSQTMASILLFPPCFNTLWIYTALKPSALRIHLILCFNTLWIYTALKLILPVLALFIVSIPSEFTLLSNQTGNILI